MNYLIAFAVFIASSVGIYLFLRKKISFTLSEVEERRGFGVRDVVKPFMQQFRHSQLFLRYAPEKVLHKALSRARVLSLKTENKIAFWLEKLRHRAQKKNGSLQEQEEVKKLPGDYWERLKGKK